MVDLAGGLRAHNYRIRRQADRRSLADLLLTTFSFLMVAGALLFCLWVRCRILEVGYEVQQLQAVQKSLRQSEEGLVVEEETLKHPERLERIAQEELGMIHVRMNQVLPPGVRALDSTAATSLALANVSQGGGGARRTSPVN